MRRGGAVLAGGRSTRMGRDKAGVDFHGEPLVVRCVRRLARAVDTVVVVARPGQSLPPLPPGIERVDDDTPDLGPLGGLAPGLRALGDRDADAAFVTACDAPFLQPAFVDACFHALGDHDAVVGDADGHAQVLSAVYRTRLAEAVEHFLAEGGRRPFHLLERVDAQRLSEADLRAADPELQTLEGCNTPEALTAALERAAARDHPVPVSIELFEMARRMAGVPEIRLEARRLRDALREAAHTHPALVPDVLDADGAPASDWRVAFDGGRFIADLDAPLFPQDRIILVSALAGG